MADDIILRRFDSIHKFVNHACENPDKSAASHTGHRSWCGTASFEEAVEFAKFGGWEPDYAPTLRKGFDNLVPKLRQLVDHELERRMNTSGDEVNVGLFVEGEPDHMIDWVPNEDMVTKRAVCLIIGHSVSGGCSAKDIFVRGQAVIGLVRALALFGFELEIWSEETVSAFYGGDDGANKYATLVRLHAAGEIMDESAVEFAIGNPSWLRRLLFASQENESAEIRRTFGFGGEFGGGYGSITDIHFAEMVNADLELNLGRTWFTNNEEGPIVWIVEQLKLLGVLPEDMEWEE